MTVGDVLGTTVRIWIRNFPRLFVLTVLAHVPAVGFYLLLANDRVSAWFNAFYTWLSRLHPALRYAQVPGLAWIPLALFGAAIAVCVVAQLRDERASIWRGLAVVLRRAHWIILLALVAQVLTSGVFIVIDIVRWDDRQYFPRRTELGMVVYGAIWIAMSSITIAAIPIEAVERRGAFGALARAWRLVRGAWWKVLAVVLVHYVLRTAIFWTLFIGMVRNANLDGDRIMLYSYIRFGIDIVLAALWPTLAAVVYERLRSAHEGPAETQLQRVFG